MNWVVIDSVIMIIVNNSLLSIHNMAYMLSKKSSYSSILCCAKCFRFENR